VAVLVAVLRIADVIDTLVSSDKPTDVSPQTPGRWPDAIPRHSRKRHRANSPRASALRDEALMLFR